MTCWLDSEAVPARGVTYVGQAVGKDDEHLHLAVRGGVIAIPIAAIAEVRTYAFTPVPNVVSLDVPDHERRHPDPSRDLRACGVLRRRASGNALLSVEASSPASTGRGLPPPSPRRQPWWRTASACWATTSIRSPGSMTSRSDRPVTQRIDPTWLDAVPRLAEDEAQGEVIVLQGWLVRAPAGRVRLAIREVCLEFRVEDVVGVREQAAAPEARASGAISAELRLRPGASLLAVTTWPPCRLTCRPGTSRSRLPRDQGRLIAPPSPAYAAAEASYLEHHQLTIDDP